MNPQESIMVGKITQEIEARIREKLNPKYLEIINDSAKHSGHIGDDGSGESHLTIIIESDAFQGLSRLARQRLVNSALGDIPGNRVHALSIKARTQG